MIERKVRYDGTTVDVKTTRIQQTERALKLVHYNEVAFTMNVEDASLTVEQGDITYAYYWIDRPYNLYIWFRNQTYIGAYYNIVGATTITADMVQFDDWIVDVLVLPNGQCFVLDEDELPCSLDQFENGLAQQYLNEALAHAKQLEVNDELCI